MIRRAAALAIAALLALAASAAAVDPALKVAVSQGAVDRVVQRALPPLVRALQGLKVPDETGSKHIAILGTVDYWITDITVSEVELDTIDISLDGGLSAAVHGFGLKLEADWKFRKAHWPHIESKGSVDVSMDDSGLSIAVEMTEVDGELQLHSKSVDASLDNVHISVHGSILSWIYDIILDLAKHEIIDKTQDAVEQEMAKIINVNADAALANATYDVPLGPLVANFSLACAPEFPHDYLVISSVAALEPASHPVPPPLAHVPMPDETPDRFLGLYVDPYLFNSGLYAAYKGGALTLPPVTSPKLNTNNTLLAGVAPGLAKAFPNAPLRISGGAYMAPAITVTAKGSALAVHLQLSWQAEAAKDEWKPAFDLDVNVTSQLLLGANNGNATATPYLTAHVNYLDVNIGTISTEVGPVTFGAVQIILEQLVIAPVLKFLNGVLDRGIPLPALGGVQLVDPEVREDEGFWYFASDFNVTSAAAGAEVLTTWREY